MSSPDVEMMTCEEVGSYFLLLQKAWLGGEGCTLPNDPARLARLARIEKVSDIVLSKFQLDKNGRLFNPRLMEEWKAALKRSKDAKNAVSTREKKRNEGSSVDERPIIHQLPNTNYPIPNTKTSSSQAQVVAEPASNEASNSASPISTSAPAPSEAAGRVTAKLAEILGRENLKPTTVKAWAVLADRVLAKHSEQEVLVTMQWALVDADNMFWRGRVYSMKHFASFFGTINQQFHLAQKGAEARGGARDPLAERAASLKTGHDFSALEKGELQ